jgi:hypothetical protein
MNNLIPAVLLVVFLVHLGAFSVLWFRRRQGYYIALVITFALLSLAVGVRLAVPELEGVNGMRMHETLRYGALGAALVSISWTLTRVVQRLRQRGRQNCS